MPNPSPSSTDSLTTGAVSGGQAQRREGLALPVHAGGKASMFALGEYPAVSPGRGTRPVRGSTATRQARHQPRPAAADRPHQASQRRRDHLREGGARVAANQRLGRRHQEPAPGHAGTRGVWRDRPDAHPRCHTRPRAGHPSAHRSSAVPRRGCRSPPHRRRVRVRCGHAACRQRSRLACSKALPANKTQHKTALTTEQIGKLLNDSTTTAAPSRSITACS